MDRRLARRTCRDTVNDAPRPRVERVVEPPRLPLPPLQEMRPGCCSRLTDQKDGFCRGAGGADWRLVVNAENKTAAQDETVRGELGCDIPRLQVIG